VHAPTLGERDVGRERNALGRYLDGAPKRVAEWPRDRERDLDVALLVAEADAPSFAVEVDRCREILRLERAGVAPALRLERESDLVEPMIRPNANAQASKSARSLGLELVPATSVSQVREPTPTLKVPSALLEPCSSA
jgi:hypothetical protein